MVRNPTKCSKMTPSSQPESEIWFHFVNHSPPRPLFSPRSQTVTGQLAGFRKKNGSNHRSENHLGPANLRPAKSSYACGRDHARGSPEALWILAFAPGESRNTWRILAAVLFWPPEPLPPNDLAFLDEPSSRDQTGYRTEFVTRPASICMCCSILSPSAS